MSSTRTAQPDAPLAQERWASSRVYARALKANLIALRCSVLADAKDRELIWHLQSFSGVPGAFEDIAAKLRPVVVSADDLRELCLNPEGDLLETIGNNLRRVLVGFTVAAMRGGAVTEISKQVRDALEYCHQSRGMVLVAGHARTGKTWEAQRWCLENPGRARYVQVPSVADDLAFFVAIAKALGITIESNAKTKNLRPRIEAALAGGDLILVCDESHNLWPSYLYRLARPSRICWLMTALTNQRVPVALIGTEQFMAAQHDFTKKTGWQSSQFIGRVERYIELPERLKLADLEKVARYWFPKADAVTVEAVAHYANVSEKHVAAIEHLAKRAAYLARQAGDEAPGWEYVKIAMLESPMPTDSRVVAMLSRTARVDTAPATRGRADELIFSR